MREFAGYRAAEERTDGASARAPLRVGPADDPAERDAEATARRVMARIESHVEYDTMGQLLPTGPSRIRRAVVARPVGGDGGVLDADTTSRIRRSVGRPLDASTNATMSTAFGVDVSGVRVHTGTEANVLNRSLDARAFTVGSDVFFRDGEYRPTTASGQRLLAHELAHTMQQDAPAARRVKRTMLSRGELGRAVVRRARSKDRDDPYVERRRRQRDLERQRTRRRARRRAAGDEAGDADEYPLGREIVGKERRQRRRQNKAARAEERRKEAEEADRAERHERREQSLRDVIDTADEEAFIEGRAVLEQDVPRDWLVNTTNSLNTSRATLAGVAARVNAAKTDVARLQPLQVVAANVMDADIALSARLVTDRQALAGRCATALARVLPTADVAERFTLSKTAHEIAGTTDTLVDDLTALEGRLTPLLALHQAPLAAAAPYPNLKLTRQAIVDPSGMNAHPATALQRLNGKMASSQGGRVTGWTSKRWPQTRGTVKPQPRNDYLLPDVVLDVNNVDPANSASGTLSLQIGPEIVIDWLYNNPAHGLALPDLVQRVRAVLDSTNHIYKMFKPKMSRQPNGNWIVECNNYAFNCVLNGAKDMLITYYLTS